MRQALSARYGGLLVDASECDYTSFKHLHLLCPNCKKTVFLVGAKLIEPHTRKLKGDRTTQVKGSIVDSYFAHHPDTDKSAVEACELRVRSMTEHEKVMLKAQSRKQLLRVLHAHFWKIFTTYSFPHSASVIAEYRDSEYTKAQIVFLKGCFDKASIANKMRTQSLYATFIDNLIKAFRMHENTPQMSWMECIENSSSGLSVDLADLDPLSIKDLSLRQWFEVFVTKLDVDVHKLICFELLSFLAQPRQRPILKLMIEVELLAQIHRIAIRSRFTKASEAGSQSAGRFGVSLDFFEDFFRLGQDEVLRLLIKATRGLIGMNQSQFETTARNSTRSIISNILMVDWASGYDALENAELEKSA